MGRPAEDAETILVFRGEWRVNSILRAVFTAQTRLFSIRPNAVGFINYDRAIAAVRRRPDGQLYMHLAEPLLEGWGTLRRWRISN